MSADYSLGFVEDLKRQWLAMIDAVADPLVVIDDNYHLSRRNLAHFSISAEVNNRSKKNPIISSSKEEKLKCYSELAGRTSPCPGCRIHEITENQPNVSWNASDLSPTKEYEIRAHLIPSDKEDQKQRRIVVHYRDITAERELQSRLAHADKLAALGQMAGGVAHEINSPLAGILAFSQILLSEISPTDSHYADIEQIEIAAKKCKEIVENLLSFARSDAPTDSRKNSAQPVRVFDEIQKILKMIAGVLSKQRVTVIWNVTEGTDDMVYGHPREIGQIFLNLITNAVQSLEKCGGGNIEIRAFKKDQEAKEVLCVEVADSGAGIPAEIIDRIFDPFFTTKPVGEGTGLGLSITYSLVRQHGGHIQVSSLPGEGCVFRVELPVKKEDFPHLTQSSYSSSTSGNLT